MMPNRHVLAEYGKNVRARILHPASISARRPNEVVEWLLAHGDPSRAFSGKGVALGELSPETCVRPDGARRSPSVFVKTEAERASFDPGLPERNPLIA
jgi:hypothetical protein